MLTDNGEAGTPVKALYDYEAAEPDELSFKTGKYSVSHYRCPENKPVKQPYFVVTVSLGNPSF